MRNAFILISGLVLFITVGVVFAHSNSKAELWHETWEYRIIANPNEVNLNIFGIRGWELVSVHYKSTPRSQPVAYLKRQAGREMYKGQQKEKS